MIHITQIRSHKLSRLKCELLEPHWVVFLFYTLVVVFIKLQGWCPRDRGLGLESTQDRFYAFSVLLSKAKVLVLIPAKGWFIRDQPFICFIWWCLSRHQWTSSEEVTLLTLCVLYVEHTNGRCAYGTSTSYAALVPWVGILVARRHCKTILGNNQFKPCIDLWAPCTVFQHSLPHGRESSAMEASSCVLTEHSLTDLVFAKCNALL